MEQIHKIKNDRIRSRRAVAPIIATLLMIAIAVVGGVMIYVFTQGFFGNSSISTSPSVDTITMTGYDMREIAAVNGTTSHEGTALVGFGDDAVSGMTLDEEGTIYIKNVGAKPYTISKLEVNGAPLDFIGTAAGPTGGQYAVITVPDAKTALAGTTHQAAQTVLPGQEATLLVSFDDGSGASGVDNTAAPGRTIPVKVTSASGSVYNFNVVVGSKS
ncbi:MAG TPA: archaellin/type IV pilin N-terminal domain-containing protein [Nitrosopumilaceae archaeon]|nr:archaellin/type IV pilin N-terminal domain-containing protein [Nitrosopumilaceae archaeon]